VLRNATAQFAAIEMPRPLARDLAKGPNIAHAVTKKQLDAEWHVSIEEAIEMEARAQAHCMQTKDFKRAYEAFAAKQKPEFRGD
jgi:enoyl-CoA hydratase/carnithine racemase